MGGKRSQSSAKSQAEAPSATCHLPFVASALLHNPARSPIVLTSRKGAYWFRLLVRDTGRMPRKPGWPR